MPQRFFFCLFAALCLMPFSDVARSRVFSADPQPQKNTIPFRVPDGFVAERVAAPPLVEHPMMACLDERGRLFIASAAGVNWRRPKLLKSPPNFIRVLDPADDKGHFDKSRVFADKMTLPMGVLWHDNSLYTASPPSLWHLRDTDKDGVADKRKELVTKFGFTGNAADVHGPVLGPDGWLYWCDGRHGHEIKRRDGSKMKGKAARIFRCKPDGSGVEVVCGGGMDNPVEIAFTPEGEPFATCNILISRPARHDAIIFAIEGGVYPWHEAYKEFPLTGELLPPVADLGWVAPAGLTRFRDDAFGREYRNNLFSAQFNRNRIQRHIVERKGASFVMKTEDFLVSDDKNFHPTDVLQDADGSLLVVDTGGWFRIGCPTSKIARPQIKGAIYRIRRKNASKVDDPRGLKLAWNDLTPDRLGGLLDDPRFAVRDRAIDRLADQGAAAIPALATILTTSKSTRACRNALWTLSRIDHPRARTLTRDMLSDKDFSVRLVAVKCAGMHRNDKALSKLTELVRDKDEHPAVRREAATALGRIGNREAVSALMEAVRNSSTDRFLEHSLLYALIRINDRNAVITHLRDTSPEVRRAALIVLDQMKDGKLTRELVTPLLNTEDRALRRAALRVIASNPSWGDEIVGLLSKWLDKSKLDEGQREIVGGILLGMSDHDGIQKLAADTLIDSKASPATRLLILDALGRTSKLPNTWKNALGKTLQDRDSQVAEQTVATLRSLGLKEFDETLRNLAGDAKRPRDLRLAAFATVAPRLKSVEPKLFTFIASQLDEKQPSLVRLAAASAMGSCNLDAEQLAKLSQEVASASALELPHLLAAYADSTDATVGKKLIAALSKSEGLNNLSAATLRRVLAKFPKEIQKSALGLTKRLQQAAEKQQQRLAELEILISGGDPDRGRLVFYGTKASCAVCHQVQKRGGQIGPDLSSIGAIRSGRDLLEALVFPSSSFARGYESYIVETAGGTLHTGVLARETAGALYLVTADRSKIRIERSDIASLLPGRVSIMPEGLDKQLSKQELRDLLAYLQSLR